MIIVDSREKKWDHIKDYFDKNNVEYVFPRKLDSGDYFNTDNPGIVIDRKANLQELCGNLSRGEKNIIRFTSECKRAKQQQLRLIVLIEGTNFREIRELSGWRSKYGNYTGKWLSDRMFNLTISYNVEWMFCRKNETAKKILEVLQYEERHDNS